MQHDIIDKTEIFKISCISFILFSIKWFLSFYLFSDENLTIKIIEDISSTPATFDSHTYLHYVKALSNLDFEGLYNSKLSTTHLIVIPYGSVVFHAFFYKVLLDFGFILVEYISITLFIIVFYKIFIVLNFSKPISLLLAVLFLPHHLFLIA